jgi:hypothetical protein
MAKHGDVPDSGASPPIPRRAVFAHPSGAVLARAGLLSPGPALASFLLDGLSPVGQMAAPRPDVRRARLSNSKAASPRRTDDFAFSPRSAGLARMRGASKRRTCSRKCPARPTKRTTSPTHFLWLVAAWPLIARGLISFSGHSCARLFNRVSRGRIKTKPRV